MLLTLFLTKKQCLKVFVKDSHIYTGKHVGIAILRCPDNSLTEVCRVNRGNSNLIPDLCGGSKYAWLNLFRWEPSHVVLNETIPATIEQSILGRGQCIIYQL